jgi:hypothetical protein
MSFQSQPAYWAGEEEWSRPDLDDRRMAMNRPELDNQVWDGRFGPRFPPNQANTGPTFTDRNGRRCRVVCDPRPVQPRNPQYYARFLIGRTVPDAKRIYPDIRVVVRDGQQLPVTMDYRPDRINVETRNGVITKVVGFY